MVRLDASANLKALVEAMNHGRDGYPRWIVVEPINARDVAREAERIGACASTQGFVPLGVDAYMRQRILGDTELDERTLLLVDTRGEPSRAHSALLDAAAHSPRPHVLLTLRGPSDQQRVIREARAAYVPQVATRDSQHVAELVARGQRAGAFVACGRHAAAERLLRDVIAALARRDARAHASRFGITLAGVLSDRGRLRDARTALEGAIGFAQSIRCEQLIVLGRIQQASVRIAEAALVEAEALCRAILESPNVALPLRAWTEAVLARALLWQGRVDEAPDINESALSGCEPRAIAEAREVKANVLLAKGEPFEAGTCVARLKAVAAEVRLPPVDVAAHAADLAVLAAAGDLARAHEALQEVIAGARIAKLPLRDAWARLVWIDALRRAGDTARTRPHLARLQRVEGIAPALLRREIRRLTTTASNAGLPATTPQPRSVFAIALLRMTQEDDDDMTAVRRVVARIGAELHASRIDLWSCAGGPSTTICSSGDGLPTKLGARVLETGLTIGPERQNGGMELGVPVRFASRLIAGLVGRWPVDRAVYASAGELMDLSAVVLAPRIDAWLAARREEAKSTTAVPELVGVSEGIATVRKAIVRAAAAPFAVLVEGESGVGKELVARAVHYLSPRRERRFCDVNCAALPEELLESELFGHAKGAFSGAVVDRAGLFEEADGGTLLLDEVADLSPRAQAKLLRVIQQQEIRRVGESFSRKIDVRIVAAANRDMRVEAEAGRFRQDLLYRLDVIRIRIPPLRERPEDIPMLAEHCWKAAAVRTGSRARLSPATLSALARHNFPGNVRELQNVIAALAVAAPPRGWVRPSLLPSTIGAATTVTAARLADARAQFERRFVEVALAGAGGNRARAARTLGLSRQGLLKTLLRLGLDTPGTKGKP
jgi:DNA-binding NtrC family response regulator/tetratricopeptide (TPR) repeat protein